MTELTLKTTLKEVISKEIKDLEKTIVDTKLSLSDLESTDLDNTQYIIDITSYYLKMQEKHARTACTGNLKEAIKEGEQEFARIGGFEGGRRSTEIDYTVSVQIRNRFFEVPKECYKEYIKK